MLRIFIKNSSPLISSSWLPRKLRAAAKDAHRQLRQIEVKQQAPDHPILWGVPETNYLKFFLFQVI
jgi:23S rRNA (cytosine1962-C5)-methyltransferase